jgi:hypothetical protein
MKKPTLNLLSAAREISDEVLWQSEPMLIGKTSWIIVLYKNPDHKKLFTGYHFHDENYNRYCPCDEWKSEKNHPRYNYHDGTYAGLPKTLVKLYEKYEKFISEVRLASIEKDALLLIEKQNNKKEQTLF